MKKTMFIHGVVLAVRSGQPSAIVTIERFEDGSRRTVQSIKGIWTEIDLFNAAERVQGERPGLFAVCSNGAAAYLAAGLAGRFKSANVIFVPLHLGDIEVAEALLLADRVSLQASAPAPDESKDGIASTAPGGGET